MAKLLVLVAVLCFTINLSHSAKTKKKEPTCYSGVDYRYKGTLNVTKSGTPCQRWDSNTPHNLTRFRYRKNYFPDKSVKAANNYCRAPDSGRRPWCHTTNKKLKQEYCDMPICKGLENCYFFDMQTYKGNVSKSQSGKTCLRWDSKEVKKSRKCGSYCRRSYNFPDASIKAANNFCRQPKTRGKLLYKPWCFVSSKKIENCNVKKCPTPKCGSIMENVLYRGSYSDRLWHKEGKKRLNYYKKDTKEECASECKKTSGCNFWNYRPATSRSKYYRKKCYLLKKYTKVYNWRGCVSGPKNIC